MSYKSSVTMAELKEAQATYKKLQLLQEENADRIEKLEKLFEDLDTGVVAIKVPDNLRAL
jgi:predicted  nucleic acid-binding Zn-ribbon protein